MTRPFSVFFAAALFCLIPPKLLPIGPIGFGIYGGYNHAHLSSFEAYRTNPGSIFTASSFSESFEPGYSVGAYANLGYDLGMVGSFPFPLSLLGQVELAYSSKGGRANFEIGSSNVTTLTLRYSYLELPLLARLKTNISLVGIYLTMGVGFSFLQIATSIIDDISITTSGPSQGSRKRSLYDIQEENARPNRFNLNYLLGGGVSYRFLSLFEVFLETRYSLGLLDIHNEGSFRDAQHNDVYILTGVGMKI